MKTSIQRMPLRRWALPVLLMLSAAGMTGRASAAEAELKDDILQTSGRLLTEERRQTEVRRRLAAVVRRVDWLLGDLAANQLEQKGKGDVIGKVNVALSAVNESRVPKAVEALMRARSDLKTALPHLESADKEIEIILAELVKLLKDLGSSMDEEALLKNLRALIASEDFIRRQTAAWGRKLFLEPEAADVDKSRLAQVQSALGDRYGEFEALLNTSHESARDTDTKRRLAAAKTSVAQSRPDLLIRNAASHITVKAPIDAVSSQDKTLAALREVERILTEGLPDEAAAKDLVEDLKRILENQKALRADTAEPKGNQFTSQTSELASRQMDIQNDLASATADSPLSAAQQAMQDAVSQINAANQAPAVQSQDAAIAALESALSAAESAAMEGAPGEPTDMPGMPTDMPGMSGTPMSGAPMPGMPGMPMPGLPMPGMPMPMQGIPPPATMSPPDDMLISAGGQSLAEIKGDGVQRTRSSLTALQQRARAAAIQKYVQQVPPEFRKQVAEYYEVLAE